MITDADLSAPGPRIVFVNRAICEMTGYAQEELLAQTPRILQGPRTDRAELDRLRVSLRGGEPFQGQTWNYRKDGTPFVMWWRIEPLVDDDGAVRHFVAFHRDLTEEGGPAGSAATVEDVTEQRGVEERLRLISSAVAHTAHGVMVVRIDGSGQPPSVVYVNPAYEAITGYGSDELVGRPPGQALVLDTPMADRAGRAAAGATGAASGEIELRRKHGSIALVEWIASAIRDDAGMTTHLVVVVRDLTGLRAAERDLRESLEGLRAADRERRHLVAQLVEAQEQELDRMAEGIEDRSLQHMSAVRMRMETLRRSVSEPDQLGAIEKLESSVAQAVGQLRGLLSELRPRELATEGLAGAIRTYLAGLADGPRARLEGDLAREPAPAQRATAFRIVQESVALARGARGATCLRVTLEDRRDGFRVRIHDDGAPPLEEIPATIGDRARLAGGTCTVGRHEDGGTVLDLWLPAVAPSEP
jgi:PAS domain S-box-containing protein